MARSTSRSMPPTRRSEERRVGKECRSRWTPCQDKKKRLCRQYANGRYQVHFEFHPWQSGIAELVEHGQLDLVLHIDDGLLPSHFPSERLYREDWVCAVARASHFGDRLPLKQYLAASHIVVAT